MPPMDHCRPKSIFGVPVDLGTSFTNSITDKDWDVVGLGHLASWSAAEELLRRRTFFHGDREVDVQTDWQPATARVKAMQDAYAKIYGQEEERVLASLDGIFPNDHVILTFDISLHQTQNDGEVFHHDDYIEYFLYDAFLTMNFANPGSFDLYAAQIGPSKSRYIHRISLSNFPFDASDVASRSGKWPQVDQLDLNQVKAWVSSIRPGISLLPRTRMERVLFAVLHICKTEIHPSSIIWVFYALESLFDTKTGENFRILISRIQLLLEPNASEFRMMKKRMRELYNMRSAFVHGGFEVIHPMQSEYMDKSIEKVIYEIMEATEFGFSIILASIQTIIRNGWTEPEFKEVLQNVRPLPVP